MGISPHGGRNEGRGPARRPALRLARALAVVWLCAAGSAVVPLAQETPRADGATPTGSGATGGRTRYEIRLELDFDGRGYTGTERVRWVNPDKSPASALYFHLYPNLRAEGAPPPTRNNITAADEQAAPDEPRLEVTGVTSAEGGAPLPFSLEDQGVTLRLQLREAVGEGGAAEIEIRFRGRVPEIDADETSLSAHVVQQVGAAIRESRETRRARDTNFSSRGVMLLGSFYPVLAARDGNDWQRRVEPSVGDALHAEVADYDVTVRVAHDVALFTSGETRGGGGGGGDSKGVPAEHYFEGRNLRNFVVLAGRALRSSERTAGGLRVRSVYRAEHERVGQRVLAVAAEAARVFAGRFGPLPFGSVTVTEAPLVAGLGSAEFSGLGVIASAFYVDFDSPAMRNLPDLVREQRASVEDSLEFAVAHVVAHQWWGATVGGDSQREPVLNEALAHWSALLYYEEAYGRERARLAEDDQLRGVYQIYRTFGGEDRAASAPAREYRNSFQYAAIVAGKGALLFVSLRQLLGEERFFRALRGYFEGNRLEVAALDDLRGAFAAEAEVRQRRVVTRTFNRWLEEKHGDEDIAPPNAQLAAALGLSAEPQGAKDRNAFARLGRFFWRQMTRIR